MNESNQVESTEEAKKKQIEMYKTALKYFRARSLTLDMIVASKRQRAHIPDNMKTYDMLNENIKELHNGTTLLESIRDCANLIKNSLTCSQMIGSHDFQFRKNILEKIDGIIYFSRSIIKLYEEKISELNILDNKKAYTTALVHYNEHLNSKRSAKNNVHEEDTLALEKAEFQIYKINLIRAIKAILIGYTSVNKPELIPQFEKFLSSHQRKLTIEDFEQSWDIGLNN